VASLSKTKSFPAAKVKEALMSELTRAVTSSLKRHGMSVPKTEKELAAKAFVLDSLRTIDILITIEDVVGKELPDSIVRAGGYNSINDALDHLLPNIEKFWNKGAK
jgi:acyl carrier protein